MLALELPCFVFTSAHLHQVSSQRAISQYHRLPGGGLLFSSINSTPSHVNTPQLPYPSPHYALRLCVRGSSRAPRPAAAQHAVLGWAELHRAELIQPVAQGGESHSQVLFFCRRMCRGETWLWFHALLGGTKKQFSHFTHMWLQKKKKVLFFNPNHSFICSANLTEYLWCLRLITQFDFPQRWLERLTDERKNQSDDRTGSLKFHTSREKTCLTCSSSKSWNKTLRSLELRETFWNDNWRHCSGGQLTAVLLAIIWWNEAWCCSTFGL